MSPRWNRRWATGSRARRRPAAWQLMGSGCVAAPRRKPPGTHPPAAFSARLQGIIGQLRVDPDANEITGVLQLLKTLPLKGATITGDAMFTQRESAKSSSTAAGIISSLSKPTKPHCKRTSRRPSGRFPLGNIVCAV